MPFGVQGNNIPTLTIGGRVFTDLTNLIMLYGYTKTTKFTSLRKPNGTAGYQVTAGKTLTILAFRMVLTVKSSSAGAITSIAYSDNDVGINSSTTFTNPIYLGGDANNGLFASSVTGEGIYDNVCNFAIPAAKYLGVNNGGTANESIFQAYGYEV